MNSAPIMKPLLVLELLCGLQWATRQMCGVALSPSFFVGRQIRNEVPADISWSVARSRPRAERSRSSAMLHGALPSPFSGLIFTERRISVRFARRLFLLCLRADGPMA